ncbi:hypothetical protein DICPUDRAFT_157178 [Dictyostelium purpureum]|uniref:Peptidase M20 dimerisation domain-containing protein n=1 Tax=Dictyostelium purpureum TaxID=5786 RepID=F0ZYG6_DICPU|nr:uncharacterized protein DICPUDRAFT_157178 [Dictyostelium purpureum]EGC31024.1 hypothetical protein DICPUDRAFT_157178 [Dictyostelium purpureum]|eukprot:XP_003292462.1 hypothetical protein DICPUDRAFT_157178 [Dictyostelium purpureum]
MSICHKGLKTIEDISHICDEYFQSSYWLSKKEFSEFYLKLKDMDPTFKMNELLIYLNYVKKYPTFRQLSSMTGHSSALLQRALKKVVELVCEIYEQEPYNFNDRLNAKPILLKGKLVYAIVDTSIYKIERPSPSHELEKLYYSPEHGFHGIKFEFCVDTDGSIVWASGYYDGATQDLKISQISDLVKQKLEPNERVLANLGYVSKDFEYFFLTGGKDFIPPDATNEEVYMDKVLKEKRSIIENLFGHQKSGLGILKQKFRVMEELIKWRRSLHCKPELGWCEFETCNYLYQELKKIGYAKQDILLGKKVINVDYVRGRNKILVEKALEKARGNGVDEEMLKEMEGYTGMVVVFDSGVVGPTVALRFDIDCVGVHECELQEHIPNKEGFRSNATNCHHACGHDGHMTIGLSVAKWLFENKQSLCGRVKIVFQPAEEGVRGARPMAESGIVDDANYFLSSHLGFIAKSGEVVVNPTNFLCTTKYDFRFYGSASHAGAEPHLGKNALAGACNAATQMLAIPRHGNGMSRINVGVISAGTNRNVTPAYGELQLEVRGENEEINKFMCESVERIAKGSAMSHDLRLETEIMGEAVDLTNDKEMIQLVSDVVSKHSELKVIETRIFGGSEDATILARRVQKNNGKAIYFVIGSDLKAGHHQGTFDFDETSLLTGNKIYTECLFKLLNKK